GEEAREGAHPFVAREAMHTIEPGVPGEERRRQRFDRPAQLGLAPRPSNAPEQRQRADHVAQRTRQHDQDAHDTSPVPALAYALWNTRRSSAPTIPSLS